MPEFKSWKSYWQFEETIKNNNRYVHTPDVKEFLDTVHHTSEKHSTLLEQETVLWRSQLVPFPKR